MMAEAAVKRTPGRGRFITFEGGEGSGKSTQIKILAERLGAAAKLRTIVTREPGGSPGAEIIRHLVLSGMGKLLGPDAETLLFAAARDDHVRTVIKPALNQGIWVLCDRFSDSTFAYQGYGRGLNLVALQDMNRMATDGLEPDLTLLLEVPVTSGMIRRRKFALEQNRLDQETHEFHEKVRRGFLALAAREPKRIKKIDGLPHPETVAVEVGAVVHAFLAKTRTKRLKTIPHAQRARTLRSR